MRRVMQDHLRMKMARPLDALDRMAASERKSCACLRNQMAFGLAFPLEWLLAQPLMHHFFFAMAAISFYTGLTRFQHLTGPPAVFRAFRVVSSEPRDMVPFRSFSLLSRGCDVEHAGPPLLFLDCVELPGPPEQR